MVIIESEDQIEYIEILNECREGKSFCFVTDYEFQLSAKFSGLVWNCSLVVFKNCHFTGHLYFVNTHLGGGVQFENCTFMYGVTFDSCRSGDHHSILSDGSPFSISFSGCEVNNRLIVKDCNFQHKILIHRNSKVPNLEFENTRLSAIEVKNSSVLGEVEISGFVVSSSFDIQSTTFLKTVKFLHCGGDFYFSHSSFDKDISVCQCVSNYFDARDIHCHGEFNLNENSVTTELLLRDSVFERTAVIIGYSSADKQQPYIEKLNLKECDFKGGITFSGAKNQHDVEIGNLLISCSNRLKGNLNFIDAGIGNAEIFGINDQSILMAFCRIRILTLSRFINRGALSLVSIHPIDDPNSLFKVSKSVMGKTFISDCDLRKFSAISIQDSNLTELTSSSVRWFNENQLNKTEDVEMDLKVSRNGSYGPKKELYRQLKFAMERQGDLVARLDFKKREFKCYRLELKYQDRYTKVGDRLILWLNLSNEYGFNWLRPMGLLLLFTFSLYLVMAIGINADFKWSFDLYNFGPTVRYLVENCHNYFILLNPTHKVDELFQIRGQSKVTIWFYFADFLGRVIVSYLIFQTITAFRKYTL